MTSTSIRDGCIRQRIEQWELSSLSPYAAKSALSRGRLRPEPPCPVRTCFQRDRDRILHSKAFRRLKHKTQVFLDPEQDHYRTRLTHTLEVAQIARTISRALRLNEDLTEAIALAHDLGHPPFGHAGEQALDEVLQEYLPGKRFRHWEQSLRVVDVLERDGKGLNLTHETREGILYHSKGRADLDADLPSDDCTLEAQVVRIADRIAYVNHDIDDAIRAKVIQPNDLPTECVKLLGETSSERIASMVLDVIENSLDQPQVRMSEPVQQATDALKEFLFEQVYQEEAIGLKELQKAKGILKSLFRLYMEQPELLPQSGRVLTDNTSREVLAQVVCDYLAGMTDRFAMSVYSQYFVPRMWHITS
ncbi:MAG: deoxyguanosinetriphosphate triphosphohydrolase [Chthonomonadetes bacterium]|nr:deoxyguanosinetriphosphate triphosphohydrolase [Chthonomonadetes bacterium]